MTTAVQSRSSRESSTPIRANVRFTHTPDRHYLHPKHERPITPEYFKREKSPFELGDCVDLQVFSSNAIIDKASVMDISNVDVKNVDEYIQLFLTEYCVIDRAGIEDVSEPSVKILVVEEDEATEKKRTGMQIKAPKPIIEPIVEEKPAEQQKEKEETQTVPSSDESSSKVGQEQTQKPSSDENKSPEGSKIIIDDAPKSSDEKTTENIAENVATATTTNESDEKKKESDAVEGEASEDKAMDAEGSDTAIESDSDFDNIEEIDPSYGIDQNLWKSVKNLDECDFKPPQAAPVEGAEEEKKKKKEDEGEAEEDSGYAEFYRIRSEKERDEEFQEYIRELCRPTIVSYLPDRVAAKGSNVRLTCTVKGNNIQTRWTKNDEPLERGKKAVTKSDGEIHILEINDITEREAGVYTAYFKNRAGEVETSTRIKVFNGKLHKPDHIDIALVKDYYDHSLGGLVIEAHVHGLPTPNVKFYKDNHLIHARRNKVVFFVENKEIFQCLMVRPDASVSGTYTILAENAAGKRRFDHHVDFKTKYPLIHLPGMYHADKKLDDFVENMLDRLPKKPDEHQQQVQQDPNQIEEPVAAPIEAPKEEIKEEVKEPPKPEEIVEALQEVVQEKPKKHKSKSKSKSKKKRSDSPKIDADLINDGEDEASGAENAEEKPKYERKFSTVVHEPYEPENFRIYNSKQKLWWSGKLKDQTVIEGSKVKLICAVEGPQPIMKWTKDEKSINWGQHTRNITGEGIGQIIFEKISRQEAGTYTCSATNMSGQIQTSATIRVIPKSIVPSSDASKPFFSRNLGQYYHITENDLILDAHVRAVPEPTVKWFKDGIELTKAMDDRFDLTNNHDGGYQFRIHNPVDSDSGLYACEATNSEGKAKVSHKVEFTSSREKHTHPKYVYHKDSFYQPTMRMSITPEPEVKKENIIMPRIDEAAAQSGSENVNIKSSQDSSSSGDQGSQDQSGNSDGSAQQNGSGSNGDGNEDGDDKKEIPKTTTDTTDAEEEQEEEVKKPQKQTHRPRRRRYEGPVEPLLIRDSVQKISLAVQLRDITAPAGSKIKLCCQVKGPGPQCKWFKNGKPLDQSPELRITGTEGFAIVTISKTKPKDSGVYKMVAVNKFNTVETEANVTIYPIEEVSVKPTFIRITDYYRQEVDDLIIEVQVRGTPQPTIVWTRDGVELDIENNERFFVMREPEGVYKLCIHDPSPLDGGRFAVVATNSAGKEEIRKVVKFLGKEKSKYLPGICHADPKKPHEKTEGDQIADQPIEEPAAPEEEEVLMDKWGNVKPKKEKKLRLREKVFLPPSEEKLAEESLVLKQVRNHLEFESELKNIAAKVGTKTKLLCTVSGKSPTLTWFKNDEPLEFTGKIKNTSNGSFGSVTFLALAPEDEGTYKCVASNEFVEISSECILTVIPVQDPNWIKPTFTRNLKEYYDLKTNDLVLEVHVRGYPRPRLEWNKDGLGIEDGDEKFFTTRHPDGVYRLNIHDPLIRDSGRYGCRAINEAGCEDFKYYLKVKSREEYIHTAGLYHADPTQFAKYKEEEERKRQERLAYRPPPRPKVEEVKPEPPKKEEVVEEEEEEETEYETTDSEYDDDGELIYKEPRKKIKEPKIQPKEPTPPPKEATPELVVEQIVEEIKVEELPKKERKERNWLQGAPEGIAEPVKEVVKKPKYQLEFLTKLENRTGVENTGVKLFCQISGPRPEVIWLHNGTPIEKNDENRKNVSNDNVAALSFIKARPDDSGEYTCIVKNRECRIEATCTLTILEVPKPIEKGIAPHYPFGMKHSFNSLTDELIIECVIRGTPRLFIKWYKDAKELENDDKYLMSREGETYKLFVHKPTFRDSGIYLVQTENIYGMEFQKYVIEFEQKETPIFSGFIYHADLSKTKKFQEEEERKRQERMAYKPPPLPIPEPEPVKEPTPQKEEIVEEEEESEYETTDSEYDEDGELIYKEPRKKVKVPPKEPTPPPKEPTPPPKEPTPPPKEPTPPPKEPTPEPIKEKTPELPKEKTPEPEVKEAKADDKKDIEKPLHVFRAHKILDFRKNAEVPLEIIKRLISTVAKVGSKVKLSCCVSDGERIKAFWFKNDESLPIDSRFIANATEDGLVTLEIKEIQLEDAGRYKVVVKTKKGEVTSQCDVNVYGDEASKTTANDVPPTLVTTVVDQYRPIYNDVLIEVRIRGTPKPTIKWIRDGLPIDPWKQYQKYQVKHDEINNVYQQQLIITDANIYRDNGKYIIIAENRAGTLELVHMLDFEGKKTEVKRKRMDDIFIVNEVPRVNPKPKSPTPPPVVEVPVEEPPKEEEVVEEEEVEEEEEEEDEEEEEA
ncbi:hypothetical protein PVAND_005397 [Polypedilum vanderplanki]|uniref:Ig-like domain-containing protein n=1 Tax=Polypedilum vanderplanki TaxID=319348 RepID=A0A9J6C0X3_POLVA|nr:hypothetical protein PVAND_005397 [Polypedilum vanderplanki]